MMPPTPPSADAMPNDIVFDHERFTPDTAALVSLSRIARIARPGRLRTRLDTIQRQIAARMLNSRYFQIRSSSRLLRSPSPKYCPSSGMFCSTLLMPLIGSQLGGSRSESMDLPDAPPVYSSSTSS